MKKIAILFTTILCAIILIGCNEKTPIIDDDQFTYTYYLMDTSISIGGKAKSKAHADQIIDEVGSKLEMYHEIGTAHETLPENSLYLENIYTINEKVGQKLEIDKVLYDLIQYSEDLKILTNGYFDISIGKIVDAWDAFIKSEDLENLSTLFAQTIEIVDAIDMTDFSIELTTEEDQYFVKIDGADIKLDLGAVAKGYAVHIANQYMVEQELEYYFITAGSSSLALGQKEDAEEGFFRIGLAHPINFGWPRPIYGRIFVKDISLATSANYEQFQSYNNLRYHHIISPKTRRPMQYYHALTLIGDNAGFLDAVGTALFSMPKIELDAWLELNQEILQIELIRFYYDGTIEANMLQTVFEELK